MARTISADGRTIVVPDDATDDEINQIVGPAQNKAAIPGMQKLGGSAPGGAGSAPNPDNFMHQVDGMTGEPTFGLGAMKHAASFAKEHPIQQALRSTEIPLLPEPLNIPGSGASLASRAYAFGKGVFSPEGREAGINMLPHGKEINNFLKIGSRNVPSAEGQILGGPAAPRPRFTSQAFEDYPVDTRGIMNPAMRTDRAPSVAPPSWFETGPRPPTRFTSQAFEDYPVDTRGIMNPAMRTDRAPSVAPPSWFETGPRPPTMQAQANDFVKSQIRPVTQMPSITSAASAEHPPFGKTSPFSPSQATRQQTPAIGGIQPTGVRGNPKALEIAKRLQEEMNKK